MLATREPYKSTFKLFTFIGIWDDFPVWQERLAKAALLHCIFGGILAALAILQANELKDIIEAVKVIPMFVILLFSMHDFYRKREKLQELLEIIDDIEAENPESSEYIDVACGRVKRNFTIIASFIAVLFCIVVICPLWLGKLTFPFFLPEAFEESFIVFLVYWMMQNINAGYCALTYIPIHEFRCSLLMVLEQIMECLRYKLFCLKEVKEDAEGTKREFEKCIRFHILIKK
jgi:hypothetical protein